LEQQEKLNYLIKVVEVNEKFPFNESSVVPSFNKTESQEKQENVFSELNSMNFNSNDSSIFVGKLSGYQSKGLSWLDSLYSCRLNGVLADDIGLGKTVQTIAFLAHLAQFHKKPGPFLIVAPSSTLNNWHQEFNKFLPSFKVLPYCGSINQRKEIRLHWNYNYSECNPIAPFNVLITSYQLVVSDVTHFENTNWQYMILDEAFKNSNSQRWKTLLSLKCTNRLLLTDTPVQKTMTELWPLLHFVVPTLYEGAEFHEWFTGDIENHAENKAKVDLSSQLQRLHLVLKPFILRRLKSEVEHEWVAKEEVKVLCDMSPRQKVLYKNLQSSLNTASFSSENSSLTLYKLVMQFRKICNHPELLHERRPKSSFFQRLPTHVISKLIYENCIVTKGKSRILYTDLNIHHPSNINTSIKEHRGTFSFLRFQNISISQYSKLLQSFDVDSLLQFCDFQENKKILRCLMSFVSKFVDKKLLFTTLSNRSSSCNNSILLQLCSITADSFLSFKNVSIKHIKKFETESTASITNVSRNECTRVNRSEYARAPRIVQNVYLPAVISPWRDWHCSHHSFFYGNVCKVEKSSFEISKPFVKSYPCNQSISDSAKLSALDTLLLKLQNEGHRVLIYSQMTKMIDILEDYMVMRRFKYLRVNRSSPPISSSRDKVSDFQTGSDVFVFLLSTHAGGAGVSLTAADTVIFFDSDLNPHVDQQAMDRALRLGQKKQVTVYRLVCRDTVEEKILLRAEEKKVLKKTMSSEEVSNSHGLLSPSEAASLFVDDQQIVAEVLKQEKKDEKNNVYVNCFRLSNYECSSAVSGEEVEVRQTLFQDTSSCLTSLEENEKPAPCKRGRKRSTPSTTPSTTNYAGQWEPFTKIPKIEPSEK